MNIDKLLNEYGEWWLPNNANYKTQGILKLRENNLILELNNNIIENKRLPSNIQSFELINGLVNDNKICLINVTENGNSHKYRYIFRDGLIGIHFDTYDSLKFNSINVYFQGKSFYEWYSRLNYELKNNFDKHMISLNVYSRACVINYHKVSYR